MQLLKQLITKLKNLSGYSKFCIKAGIVTMFGFYIIAIIVYISAPSIGYIYAMQTVHGCVEAAPACLVSGLCAAAIYHLMLASNKGH